MKIRHHLLACFLAVAGRLAAAEPEQLADSKELREQCHAHFHYTAALAEWDSKSRLLLLNKAIELDPRSARAYYNRGGLYVKKNDLARARADYQKAVELDPNHINAYYNLACVLSLDRQLEAAEKSLENALRAGYRKFDKIAEDADLKNLRDRPQFAALLANYKTKADEEELTALQQFQTSDVAGRAALLDEALRSPNKHSLELVRWALQDPDPPIRVMAINLAAKLGGADGQPVLIRALYDSNGDVCKAAVKALIARGKTVEKHIVWTLQDRDTPAPFYAVQVLAGVGATGSIDKIVPLLRDDDMNRRIVAADALARLGAVSALPQLEEALQNLPGDARKQEFYKAAIGNVIDTLKKDKENAK